MAEDIEQFLASARPVFRPHSCYQADADFLEIFLKPDEALAERVDEFLTVYWSRSDDDVLVGCEIKGVRRIVDEAGGRFGVSVAKNGRTKLAAVLFTYQGLRPGRLTGRHYQKLMRFAEKEPMELQLVTGGR